MADKRVAAWVTAVCVAGLVSAAAGKDWPQWGGQDSKNMVSDAKGLPDAFDPGERRSGKTGRAASKNVKWSVALGKQTYGGPVIAGGRIFVGTNNDNPRDRKYRGDRGVLMCFRESDAEFLWQLVVPKMRAGGKFNGDFAKLGICATPAVEGKRCYVVTNRCAVVCLDVEGLANGNDGPFTDEAQSYAWPIGEKYIDDPAGPRVVRDPGKPVKLGPTDADIIWRFDMMKEVSVWPQDASSCSVLIRGDYLYVGTPNGVDRSHNRIPYPDAPMLVVLNKHTGKLLAVDNAGIGDRIYHGQWSSPSLATVNGRTLLFYGGGDGFCYAFDAEPEPGKGGKPGTLKMVWKFDCNPPEYKTKDGKPVKYQKKHGSKGVLSPCEIIATPAFHDNRVYVTIGQDTRHGVAPGCLSCMDATKTGDISKSGLIWRYTALDRSLSTPAVADGLVYAADYTGIVHCVDAKTGKAVWTHDTKQHIWASPFVADGKVYMGTERGYLWVFAAGREKKVISRIRMDGAVCATPVTANGVLYVPSHKTLYAVVKGAE